MLLAIVIPVYNSEETIGLLVEQLLGLAISDDLEIILVDDASQDGSALICEGLAKRFRGNVVFVQLARNFGEHNAVMAGLSYTSGEYVVVMDDDSQNPPEAIPLLIDAFHEGDYDVIYSSYHEKKNKAWRIAGSWFNNLICTLMLGKPYKLYLSSFKIMSRFAVDQVLSYRGPFPYIDGLLLQSVSKIGTVVVPHEERRAGKSSYTLFKLLSLWLNTFTNFSVIPLRLSFYLGILGFIGGIALVGSLIFERFTQSSFPTGFLMLMATLVFFSSTSLIVSGMVGEYVGRVLLNVNGKPQFVVRKLVADGEEQTERRSDLVRR
jgi:undecaprenyl-phosphate 4-deoxy-4-formamido-L-arabinose transferase